MVLKKIVKNRYFKESDQDPSEEAHRESSMCYIDSIEKKCNKSIDFNCKDDKKPHNPN